MAIGKKVSPAKFLGAALSVAGGVANLIGGNKAGAQAERQQKAAQAELGRQRQAYSALDTSNIYANVENPYANMENTMEDLTVNQQQAQFQAQQGAQQRANIMQNLQGAAGGSGVAGLAQALANQGQLATQQASASIGQQEAANQMAAAQQAGQLQSLERQGAAAAEAQRLGGEAASRSLQYDKTTNLLGMASGELSAANQAASAAQAQKAAGISGIIGGVGSAVSFGMGNLADDKNFFGGKKKQ